MPQATVYRLFGSKGGILKALLDLSIAGDDQALPVQERPDIASLFAELDAAKLLAGFAGVTTAINQRTRDVYRVLLSAADSDPGPMTFEDGSTDDTGVEDGEKVVDLPARAGGDKPLRDRPLLVDAHRIRR